MSVLIKGMKMRLIDADALIWWLDQGLKCSMLKDDVQLAYRVVKHKVDKEFPTIDAVPVVRCKDCKHRDKENGFCKGRGWPMQLVLDDGFCDKGKRSEDE